MNETLFEVIFMMVILKIPIAYLCFVVYWAMKAEPLPPEGANRLAALEPDLGNPSGRAPWRRRGRVPPRPHGSPQRRYARREAATARARR